MTVNKQILRIAIFFQQKIAGTEQAHYFIIFIGFNNDQHRPGDLPVEAEEV